MNLQQQNNGDKNWIIGGLVTLVLVVAGISAGNSSSQNSNLTVPTSTNTTSQTTPATTTIQPAPVVTPPTPTYTAPTQPVGCPNDMYTNGAGNEVCNPYNSPTIPSGASAKCRDGSYSFSQSRSGTCSHHDGVAVRY
jgi:hypothetical protein